MGHGQDEESGAGGHMGHAGHHAKMFRRKFWVSLALSVPVLAYSPTLQRWLNFSVPAFPGSEWVAPFFSVIIFAYGGLPFLRMARGEAEDRRPGMMMLISLAITVAFIYSLASLLLPSTSSFFWELVTLVDVMLLGHWIEMRSIRQASGALDELAELMPETAERIVDGGTEEVPVGELDAGDRVLVRPGASIPADGEVFDGSSSVNEAMITGESRPVDKEAGDEVIGGTINSGSGSLRVEVTATGEDTALSGIMRLVEEAQQSRSKSQVLADRAAGWLFYIAVAAAGVTAAAWTLAVGFQLPVVERAVTVLVIACPHALGLAVPLVVAINTSLAAGNGILVRERIAMEQARDLDVVMFDKTGTLTLGEQRVVDIETGGMGEEEALGLMAAVEADSEHMIARAVRETAGERGIEVPGAEGFEALKGKGVTASVDGKVYHVGGPNLLADLSVEAPAELDQFVAGAGDRGETVVFLVQEREEVVAAAALADEIREESREAVDALHSMGIEVAMVTGDSEDVARAVAEDLGIDQYFAEVLPEEKDSKVKKLQQEGRSVAMVGDGVNDAPALARADVGIAIGSGTDVAAESAHIVLVQNNPLDVVKLVRLSRASYSKMRQNLAWATGYNVIALPLAAGVLAPWGVLLSPAVGALFMSASTVIVAVNAQRLRTATL
ncbi:MAG: copper-translocating P-type ATPase [Candidatus Nanohaloarchaea archaeon]|nr:copper-translocating P-type ATPase [Candidatus Nanohaloarchaea archaeon]